MPTAGAANITEIEQLNDFADRKTLQSMSNINTATNYVPTSSTTEYERTESAIQLPVQTPLPQLHRKPETPITAQPAKKRPFPHFSPINESAPEGHDIADKIVEAIIPKLLSAMTKMKNRSGIPDRRRTTASDASDEEAFSCEKSNQTNE